MSVVVLSVTGFIFCYAEFCYADFTLQIVVILSVFMLKGLEHNFFSFYNEKKLFLLETTWF